MEAKKSFLLMRDLLSTVELMDDEEAGKLLKAIINHVDGIDTELPRELIFAFTPIRNQLDRDMDKYDKFVDKQRVNGAKGGRPKKTHPIPNNPDVNLKTHPIPNNLVTVNATATDNVNATATGTENATKTANDKDKQKKVKQTRFAPPSLENVKDYIADKSFNVNPDTFFNFYESNGWKVGKNPMKSWKASLATWNSKEKGSGSKPMTDKERFYAEMRGDIKTSIDGECRVIK